MVSQRKPQTLVVELLSDTPFGGGDATAGQVDLEVEHDAFGLPVIGGKRLHGLLREAWLSYAEHFPDLDGPARRLFGLPGDHGRPTIVHLDTAQLPDTLREVVRYAVHRKTNPLSPRQVLRALTDIRRQTAVDRRTGAPARGTLRATRVVLRDLRFSAPLSWVDEPQQEDLRCLALCALLLRHAGLRRRRGGGHLCCALDGDLAYTRALAQELAEVAHA